MVPGLVDVGLPLLGHWVFGVVVALVHLPNKVEGFGFIRDDDVDGLALFLLLVKLTAKGDDVGGQVDPCLIECLSSIGALFCHDLAPFRAEVCQEHFDGLICIAKVVFAEFSNVLFFNAVNDALYSYGSDCLLEFELFLENFHFSLEG
jgi:hypothetical protein